MKTQLNVPATVLKNTPLHVIAGLTFMVLMTLVSLKVAVLIVGAAYAYWLNLICYWRFVYEPYNSPREWRDGGDQAGYVLLTTIITAITCIGAPLLVSHLMGGSLLWQLLTLGAIELFVAFYGFELHKRFSVDERD